MYEPDRLYFVTNRTVQGRLLLTPSPKVNALVGGVLGRALARYAVDLFAFTFVSNHFHLIARAAPGLLSDFVGYVEANIAREVGRHIGWRGPFWERRFSAEPILDDDALLQRVRYILSHGAKEGLVDSAEEWPGLTCIPELVHGVTRIFPWYNRTGQWWARARGEPSVDASFMETYRIDLAPLPCWIVLSVQERRKAAAQLLAAANEMAVEMREGKPALGPDVVCAQNPFSVPQVVNRSPRPLCHTSTKETFVAFRQAYRDFIAAYREASERFRSGDRHVEFPQGAFRPRMPFGWPKLIAAVT